MQKNRSPFRAGRRNALVAASSLAVVVSLALSGCAGSAEEPADDGEVELTFMNQSRGQEAALTQLAEQYTQETGVTVSIDSPGHADYLPKLQARAQSNSMPDVYSSFAATDMAPFYRAGWAMDLTSELDGGWSDNFSPTILELSKFEDGNNLDVPAGTYTVHWETQTYGLLVNPALTDINLDDSPATAEDFIEALSAADAKFSVAASLSPQLIWGLASNWLSDDEIEATFKGESSWESEGWRNAFQVLVDMKDAGVIANDSLPGGQDDNPNVESAFFTQATGAIFDASPGVSVGLRTNPEFEDYFSIGIPVVDGAPLDPRSPGVPGKGAVINPKGDHPEEALAFVKWLTEPEQQSVFAEVGRILPSNPELLASGTVPTQLAGFADGVETMQTMSTTFTTDVKTAIVAEAQRLVLGEADIDEVLANIQAAQDRSA
ncbi:carbohydrate ABC transporter substrate-binding protein [Microbacterium hatanonis]|uniref:Carbohydrate ABC transporter substrate-binding protein n=2 Tax=Microbacterium hatanonis TaxID=404366 RepID=A0A5C8HXD7_9MICO|nr:carbohydrate ABC transporter substrate-binding protein [Microbacterium hatanonis]